MNGNALVILSAQQIEEVIKKKGAGDGRKMGMPGSQGNPPESTFPGGHLPPPPGILAILKSHITRLCAFFNMGFKSVLVTKCVCSRQFRLHSCLQDLPPAVLCSRTTFPKYFLLLTTSY